MLKALLGSRTRINILKLFVFNPKREYYAREIERLINESFEPIRKELIRLESIRLLKSRTSGKQKYYLIDINHTLYNELKSMILKTVGLGDLLKEEINSAGDIASSFIYGSYAQNKEEANSDIDLFVIGKITLKKLQSIISKVENQTYREINSTLYTIEEFQKKCRSNNNFVAKVVKGKKIFLKGDEDALRELAQRR